MDENRLTAIEKMGYIEEPKEKTDRERLIERIVYKMRDNIYFAEDMAKLIVDEIILKED